MVAAGPMHGIQHPATDACKCMALYAWGAVCWKSPKMQSFGIKIERIDRDLLCIYETNAKWASVHICSVKWAEAKGDLDLRFKVVLWSTLT